MHAETTPERDLVLSRLIPAPPRLLYRAWTEPDLLRRWFAPAPFRVTEAEIDLRPGGATRIVMEGPDGTAYPSAGVYLELVPDTRIVFTDAYLRAWEPSPKPFFTGIVTFAPEAGGTRYTATARHWSEADRAAHAAMGFHEGWGRCADQLAALAATL
ncbi:SRPBCC family protein [Methylobacterium radiodurans]|uniref:Polyketide cyclase n=1 Tax=Methylobacterium radiodurans TaxID=2202828 RepID=A0A2U8VV28_9HYPH|nr:SRPBCC family protein [Methylobacterium radiodurans]AWN37565.1 polyketide cyclase [Methylobacterium radiodurans]